MSPQVPIPGGIDGYSRIAGEYYDGMLHPTCANFREASIFLLRSWAPEHLNARGLILEMGAGRSVLGEIAVDIEWNQVVLIDVCAAMLSHSADLLSRGAHLRVASAQRTGMPAASVSCLVGCLADPYNDEDFFQEAQRIVMDEGTLLLTMPAFEWAECYRRHSAISQAEFSLRSGETVRVPSHVRPFAEQLRLFERRGFKLLDFRQAHAKDLRTTRLSPKILLEGPQELPIVAGYLVIKRGRPVNARHKRCLAPPRPHFGAATVRRICDSISSVQQGISTSDMAKLFLLVGIDRLARRLCLLPKQLVKMNKLMGRFMLNEGRGNYRRAERWLCLLQRIVCKLIGGLQGKCA